MFDIVLVHPEIPPNTGNVIRLCANAGCRLHLIRPLGFELDDARLRRAGLDYHEFARVVLHDDWPAFRRAHGQRRVFGLSTRGTSRFDRVAFQPGDALAFGSESAGLPQAVRDDIGSEALLKLPMRPGNRSLNLSNAVAIVTYEAWRQHGFAGSVCTGPGTGTGPD